jgi:hypothetical protein
VSIVVLFVLAVIWAAVLLPPFFRNRSESRPADSITSFRRQLSVLERTGPGTLPPATRFAPYRQPFGSQGGTLAPAGIVMSRRDAQKRRRDIMLGLLLAMGGSLVLGLLPPLRVMLGLHILLDVLFVLYVVLLIQVRRSFEERDAKVRFLPHPSSPPEPALLLRRSAN